MGTATLLLTSSSLRSPSSFPSPKTNPFRFSPKTLKTSQISKTLIRAESNQALKSPPSSSSFSSAGSSSGADLVKQFYSGINRHDLVSVEDLISENCVYEDLIFSKPFVGRKVLKKLLDMDKSQEERKGSKSVVTQSSCSTMEEYQQEAILEFFKKFTDSISTDLQFVIDDISNEDSSAIGVTWHLEWKGRPFPFSKGCSFYRLEAFNGKKQIVYGRDSVEPATKPGEIALVYLTYCRNSWTCEANDDNPMTDC